MGMNRSRKSVARVVARSIVPPRSLIECVSYNRRTGAYRSDVGRQYRVGYYGACRDGSDVVWLVDERGKYVATTSHEDLKKYFKIIRRSAERDYFGDKRPPLRPLRKRKPVVGDKGSS